MGRPAKPLVVRRAFWRLIAAGVATEAAAVEAGVSKQTGKAWFREAGGMSPCDLAEPSGRYLSHDERERIAWGVARGDSVRQIARAVGRTPGTISRELQRNAVADPRDGITYKASVAQAKAEARARRPKLSKIARCGQLRDEVQRRLSSIERPSPEQISKRLPVDFPDDERMRISHESIYRSLYVQGKGELRRELTSCLRTGRTLRKPRRRTDERRGRIKDMVNISERPAEVADRAIPGHWEGDLIIGKNGLSQIGTLVERTTRFVMLAHLPRGRDAATVAAALADIMGTLPELLRRTLTWDQGHELADHMQLAIDADLDVYFCDPHSPWQRGSNENTNGLLRQYFPKGTDLSVHSAEHLAHIAAALNRRPRKTLDWQTPAEALAALLSDPQLTGVATTG